MSISNISALSASARGAAHEQLKERVNVILSSMGPEDCFYLLTNQDALSGIGRDPSVIFDRDFVSKVLILVGHSSAPRWRNSFAEDARDVWSRGGTVWLSGRAFSRRPKAEWNWVEGDEIAVPWSDVPSFFSSFDLGRSVGDRDGFVCLARTPHNEQILRDLDPSAEVPGPRSR